MSSARAVAEAEAEVPEEPETASDAATSPASAKTRGRSRSTGSGRSGRRFRDAEGIDEEPQRRRGARTEGPGGLPWTASADELERLASMPAEGVWHVGGERGEDLKLTNLDKVLFPPHPADPGRPAGHEARSRPLLRPDRAGAPAASRRAAAQPPALPERRRRARVLAEGHPRRPRRRWLRRWKEVGVEEREANEHLIADRVATLCWLGNQAAFEVHAWTSRLEQPFRPTFALIDIDPGTKTTWDETLVLARLYRTALEHLGVRGYPKITGKRGIQVWIPIEPKYTFADTSDWVEGLSRAIGATVPDLVSWEWAKGARGGKARLDYTQNQPIKTLVAPYCRAAGGRRAGVGADHLGRARRPELRPDRWTIRTIVERVEQVGDLFAGAQTDPQELPPLG